MDHGRYGQPEFTAAGNSILHFPVPELPFYMHQVLNPNPPPPPPNTFHDTTTVSPPPPPPYSAQTGWIASAGGGGGGGGGITTVRWPRQETLTLLEIRSRLDPCFREASSSNHKAPLWDEISRIMNDEYGYQRSGRKCKEKFENLYKYYKKTKDGKVGKHDGKHYRFFGQLEALFGDHQRPNTVAYPTSQSNYSSEYGTTSYEKNRRSSTDHEFETDEFMTAIQDSIESELNKLMVKQDEWGEKILCAIDRKDRERMVIDEEWRKREAARLAHEYESWSNHVARIEARDKSLLDALQNLIRVRSRGSSSYREIEPAIANSKGNECSGQPDKRKDWSEPEISSLIHMRINKDGKFRDRDQEDGERIWEEIAFELSLLGHGRNETECKEAWEKLCVDFNKSKMECAIVNKEVSSRTSNPVDDNVDDRNSRFRATAMNIDGERSWETM